MLDENVLFGCCPTLALSGPSAPHLQPFLHLPLVVTGTVPTSPSAGSSLAPVQTPLQSDGEISDFSHVKIHSALLVAHLPYTSLTSAHVARATNLLGLQAPDLVF